MSTRKEKISPDNRAWGDAYKIVRDATKCNDKLSVAAAVGILNLVSHELMEDALIDLKRANMND